MLKPLFFASAIASLAFSTAAISQDVNTSRKAPLLSGKYTFTETNYCQPVISGNPLVISNPGEVDNLVGAITFDSGSMTFSFSAKIEAGKALADNSSDGFNEHTLTASGPYSTTGTTFTFGDTTASATYGPAKKGITQFAAFMDLNQNDVGANCTSFVQLTHQ
jgi:hypothetical protein